MLSKRILIVATLLLHSCSHLDNWRVYEPFDGLRAAHRATGSLDILIVHGMGQAMRSEDEAFTGYSSNLQTALTRGLGLPEKPVDTMHFEIANGEVRLGSLHRTTYSSSSKETSVTFYELSWAEAVKPIKTVLLELDGKQGYREKAPLEQGRAKLNSAAKAFVNTHLADPVIYAGEFGTTLRGIVAQAMCFVTRKDPPTNAPCDFGSPSKPPTPIAIVTVSLGSALVFDTLNELFSQGRERAGAAIKIAGATTQLYMLANQMPLLELRALRASPDATWLDRYPCPSRGPAEAGITPISQGLSGFLEIRRAARGPAESAGPESHPVSVVAFSDQNDLLTYYISDRFKKHCSDLRFANVAVTNAQELWLLVAANPAIAHTGYMANERVIRMMIDGASP